MNKVIIIMLFISISLMAWIAPSDRELCNGYANISVDLSTFTNSTVYSTPSGTYVNNDFKFNANDVDTASQIAMNWWNEAASEHHLYYKINGTSSNTTKIFMRNYENETFSMETSIDIDWDPPFNYCADFEDSEIRVNHRMYKSTSGDKGTDFINTLTHELGHLLGLNHYSDTNYNIMEASNMYYFQVTEDNKYGLYYNYGWDSEKIRTARGVWPLSYNSPLHLSNKYKYESGNTYKSLVKPQIVFQPNTNKGYDYIVVWVDPPTKDIKYAFAKDSGDDLITIAGPFTISTYTLTTPSIAINKDGSNAVITWKEEKENAPLWRMDRIWKAEINTTTGGYSSKAPLYESNKSSYVYSKSAPLVVWKKAGTSSSGNYGVFIIFWTHRPKYDTPGYAHSHTNWEIKYTSSLGNNADFVDGFNFTLKHNGVPLRSYWNPMSGHCMLPGNNCVLFFNEISSENVIDYHRLTRVFIVPDESSPYYGFAYNTDGGYFRYENRYNFGHLSAIYGSSSNGNPRVLLTKIPKAAQSELSAYQVEITSNSSNSYYYTLTKNLSIVGNTDDAHARTGVSGAYNKRTGKFRFLWIEE